MKSYLACVNQSCLDITEVYKKIQLSNDNCVLSVGLCNTREIYYVNSYFGESFRLEFGISDNWTGYITVDGFGPWASFWPIWQNLIIRRENPLLPSHFSEIVCA